MMIHARPYPGRAGVTLMELLVSMAVAGVVLTVGLQLYVQTQRVIDRQQVHAARLGSEADVLSLLRRDIRAAAAVAPESTGAKLILVGLDGSSTAYQTTQGGLVRTGPQVTGPVPETLNVSARFEYPEGTEGRLVRISWESAGVPRAVTLHLRNDGVL